MISKSRCHWLFTGSKNSIGTTTGFSAAIPTAFRTSWCTVARSAGEIRSSAGASAVFQVGQTLTLLSHSHDNKDDHIYLHDSKTPSRTFKAVEFNIRRDGQGVKEITQEIEPDSSSPSKSARIIRRVQRFKTTTDGALRSNSTDLFEAFPVYEPVQPLVREIRISAPLVLKNQSIGNIPLRKHFYTTEAVKSKMRKDYVET